MGDDGSSTVFALGSSSGAWHPLLRVRYSGGNQVDLLRGGDELFPALIEAMRYARREILLATYLFHDDEAGRSIVQALCDAALRGVRVRVVVDGFGSYRSLPFLRRTLTAQGVGLAVFRPIQRWWAWPQPGQLRRLHQKLCAVDGEVGFVGGINIIDDRNDLTHGRSQQPRLDFAVSVRGPTVTPIEQTVRAIWTRAALGADWRDELLNLAHAQKPLTELRTLLQQIKIAPVGEAISTDATPMQAGFLVRDNWRQRHTIEHAYIEAIDHAKTGVVLISPYFYPGHRFRQALIKAARRGVRVRLLLQGKVDYRFAAVAARVLYDELLAAGVQLFEYTPAFLHGKAAVVDAAWATVGSSNIDPLSLLLNLESNMVVRDTRFTQQLAGQLDEAIKISRQVTAAPYRSELAATVRRGVVAWLARTYLRMAGQSGRY